MKHVLELIQHYDCKYFIENPTGMLRKMDFMRGIDRAQIFYCRYGDMRMKPTDIFSNHIANLFNPNAWLPRPRCWNGNEHCHHESAPRGSRTGTQGLKNNYEKSKIPEQLCFEILKSTT